MKRNSLQRAASMLALLAGSSALAIGTSAAAADVYLRAEAFDKTMYDGTVVPMWGFAQCDVGWVTCDAPTAPGPQLDAVAGDSLNIYLDNDLPVPVSIHAPGQTSGGNPTYFTDGLGRQRVQSLTHEVASGSTGTYSFTSVRSGSFLYQSATLPSIQVPMGLYGAMVVDPASSAVCTAGTAAYSTEASCYDAETVLVFSEVDPFLNETIDAAGAVVADYPSTVDYEPAYFMVNGELGATLSAGQPGDRVLLRLLNAGLESHIPTLGGVRMGLIAQDGFPHPGLTRHQAAILLAAGKTRDVIVEMPDEDVTFGMSDRAGYANYHHQPGNGTLADLQVGLGSGDDPDPTTYAVDDVYSVTEDTALVATSVLSNDVGLAGATVEQVSQPYHGELVLNADGTFTYTPDADFSGYDSFLYRASDGVTTSSAWVSLEVSFDNDAPVATADGVYENTQGTDIEVDAAHGVLGNDTDVDGDALSAVLHTAPSTGTLTLNADGSFSYSGGTPGSTVTFSYTASDGSASSDPVDVELQVNEVSGMAIAVSDPDGTAVTDFRWVVQEDLTYKPDPSEPANEGLALNFHKSYMPVVADGEGADMFAQLALDPTRHYYVSVLPFDAVNGDESSHTIGGAQIAPGATSVAVNVNKQPIRTAQISIRIFEDNAPTNGAIDAGEQGLQGFQIILEDAGGQYGHNGGPMLQDAFGNPLTNALDCFGDSPPATGVIMSCPDGSVLIENLPPAKYGVIAVAPDGATNRWVQTSTIEGSKVIDAWGIRNQDNGELALHGAFLVDADKTITYRKVARRRVGPAELLHAIDGDAVICCPGGCGDKPDCRPAP